MYIIVKLLIAFLLCLPTVDLFSQQIQLKGIPNADKLPINLINVFFQDSEGYMWYGTEDGLCRTDGYNTHIIRSDFKTPQLLNSNSITCLAEDNANNLWIGTAQGLYILNKTTYKIIHFKEYGIDAQRIENIQITSDQSIWISTYKKIYLLNSKRELIKKYQLKYKSVGISKGYVLYESRNGEIWLSISGIGMHKYNKQTKEFYLFYPYKERINAIIEDKQKSDCYWLASWDKGLIRFLPKTNEEKERFVPQALPINSIGEIATTAMGIVQDDTYNYFWVTSWSDLFVFKRNDDLTLQQVDTSDFLPKKHRNLKNIIKDKEGNLWVTAIDTYNFRVCFEKNKIKRYDLTTLERFKRTPAISFIYKDWEKDVLWFYQQRLGLCIYNTTTKEIYYYTHLDNQRTDRFWNLVSLVKSPKRNWVWGAAEYSTRCYALSQQNLKMKTECTIDLKSISHNAGYIQYLYEDDLGNLWIGTSNSLYKYYTDTNKLEIVSDKIGKIIQLTQTNDGNIWGIRENKCLIRIDCNNQIQEIPIKEELHCITATDTLLWLGTKDGRLLSFQPNLKQSKDYTAICNMNGDHISNLVTDQQNHIWIITSQTIKELNPSNNAYCTFSVFDKNIAFNHFMPNAVCIDREGILYFGGIPGILSIAPTQWSSTDTHQMKPHITDILLMGNSLYLNPHSQKDPRQINIYPGGQNLEIHFSALNYQNASRIRYAYKLSGIDQNWIFLPAGKNTAFYNKLEKGTYTFQVKSTDENGFWGDNITSIYIHQQPFWYETRWAYFSYSILILGIICALIYTIKNRIKLHNTLQLQKLEQNKIEEINHAKLQFFTNITHELLTPLAILSAAVDELKLTAPTYKEQYKIMKNNIDRLIRLLQQILEFRKAESGNLKLRVSQSDLAIFIHHSVDAFLPLLKKKQIQFTISCQPNPFIAWFDPDKIDKIIYNLLSNAAKYSFPNETVQIKLIEDPEQKGIAKLIIKDNGPGISPKAQENLFKRFYEGDYRKFNTIGTGIGLSLVYDLTQLHHGNIEVESSEGCGATFIVSFPFEKSAYKDEEIDSPINLTENEYITTPHITHTTLSQTALDNTKYRLLIVEDNEELMSLIVKLLSPHYYIITASNGQEALEKITENETDLVISDIMMPVMDGIEFCKQMKNNFDTCHIPIILLTAKKTEEDRAEAYQSGADAFINKPFSMNVLYSRIENLLTARERKNKDFRKKLVFEMKETDYTSMDQDFLQKAIDCINRHLDDSEFNQDQFVDEMHVSKSTSLRKLKSLTGLNFVTFVRNIRMKAACRIMEKNKDIRISELAYAVGYNDPRYFAASFKKEFDITPQEYMKQLTHK